MKWKERGCTFDISKNFNGNRVRRECGEAEDNDVFNEKMGNSPHSR